MATTSNLPVLADAELKTAFAAGLLRYPDNPFQAAQQVFPADLGAALRASSLWINDPFVKAEQMRLLEEKGARSFLPTKEEQAKDIYKMATTSYDEEIRLKAHRLYAEIMGNIEKPQAANVTVAVQNVMVIKDQGNDETWEKKAVAQQRRLISGEAHAVS